MDIILKYTLKKIQEQTSNIPNLNFGGCSQFAKLLAKELESRNINYKVTLFDSYLPLKKISKNIKNKEFEIGVGHVAIKIGNYYIDGCTISKNANNLLNEIGDCDNFSNFKINYPQLKYYTNNVYWNTRFKKSKYHSIISKIIKEQFKIYDKIIRKN